MQPPDNYLPSVIPELKLRRLTIEFDNCEAAPAENDYIVSVGKGHKIGTVYQIATARKVKTKLPGVNKYELYCIRVPEMKAKTRVNYRWQSFVDGIQAITITWKSRNKKK